MPRKHQSGVIVANRGQFPGAATDCYFFFVKSRDLSLNVEQQLAADLGMFIPAGFGNGDIEATAFTDIDRTVAAGFSLKGKQWAGQRIQSD
jgi:hypothetical protein